MPSNILTADTSFPQFTEHESDSAKIEKITSYLFMLLEQLRYSMANMGRENFNDKEFDDIVDLITEPVFLQLKDMEGNISALQVTAKGLTSRVEDAEGNISSLTQTAMGLSARVQNAEGNISTLQVTAAGLSSRVQNAEGNISSLTQTVNGMELSVSNGESSSTIKLLANGVSISSDVIRFRGMVLFEDLETSGWTSINGDNITTGTINAIDIYGCYINGSVFESENNGYGMQISGSSINFSYGGRSWGFMGVDDMGELWIGTSGGYSITLNSDANINMYCDSYLSMTVGKTVTIDAQRIDLDGDVYINGELYKGTA